MDLLPDGESSSLAAWLAKQPGVEVVCRDRAPFFAEGATAGAPQAVQVADRWHLWHNLSEAAERCVADRRGCLQVLAPEPSLPPVRRSSKTPPARPGRGDTASLTAPRVNHATVRELLAAGLSRRVIGHPLRMTSRTVKLLADAATPEDLFQGHRQGRPSKLDAFKPYLDDRWNQGCTNAGRVWDEIAPLGYQGSYQRVRAYFREKQLSPGPVTARPPSPPGRRRMDPPPAGDPHETEHLRLKAVVVHCPELDALTGHVRSFGQMLTERQGERLPQWLDAVRQDDLPGLHTLAAGIDRDRDAVTAGLTLPWNSGVVEGHVNRIKALKRQMFGRAGFALLRKRLLYS